MDDQNILSKYNSQYIEAYYTWSPFYPEAATDLNFFLGHQLSREEERKLRQEGRKPYVFNRIRRIANMITGYQRKNRLSSVVVPIESSDQKTADQLTKLMFHVMEHGDGYRILSDCVGGAVKTGWNLMSIWMDYRDDPINGDIKFGRESYSSFITDPYFSNLDFSDCNYILRRKYLSHEQVAGLLPNMKKDVGDLHKFGWERDEKFTWLPYQRQPNGQDLMAYNESYNQKWKDIPMIVDMETGEYTEFNVPKEQQNIMLKMHENLKIINRPTRYIERHIIVNDVVMKTDENPYSLNEYPFTPFVGIWEPDSPDWSLKVQSLIRCIRDPQSESNRRRLQMTDLIESQINSGWIATKQSVTNPKALFQAGQGRVIWKKAGSDPGSIEKIPPAQIPPSMFQLQEMFDRDMMEIAGVNEANFGITENAQESAAMMMLRQGASIVNLQDFMDNVRFSQKMITKKALKLIQTWSPEKIKRIINEDPTEEFYNKDFTKYDVMVTEGTLTDTQKQMHFKQLVDLKQLGVPVTAEMLAEAAPIQGKSTYIEQMAQAEKAQAEEAKKQDALQKELLESQRQLAQAQAISDIALSKERFTRAVANTSLSDERAAAAVEDRSDAALNRAKTITELQGLDDDRIMKYLGVIRAMEEKSKADEEEIKQADVAVASQGQAIGDEMLGLNKALPPEVPIEQQQQQQNIEVISGDG